MYETPYLIWSDKFETGIDIIDEQHRGLVSLINTFFYHKADANQDINRFLIPTAEMLKAYTKLHFMTLERLMTETDYPEIKKEALEHRKMMEQINDIDAKCRANRDSDGLLRFLKSYWQERNCNNDAGCIAHIRNFYHIEGTGPSGT
jgi:hemerythrin-like metal-binding protein